MNHLETFRAWLQSRHYSPSTIKNYLTDLRKYFQFLNSLQERSSSDQAFNPSVISQYLLSIQGKNNYSRYLASISLFCQYAQDQYITTTNAYNQALKLTKKTDSTPANDPQYLIDLFEKYLILQKVSSITIKNYISDIQQYLYWLKNSP